MRRSDSERALPERAFQTLLSSLVQRRVHTHFDGEAAAEAALLTAGFADARLHRADRHHAAGDARDDPAAAGIHIIEPTSSEAGQAAARA